MILESVISQVAEQQSARLADKDQGLKRELEPAVKSLSSHALIISGIRRCGKSTLLLQMMKALETGAFYLNFESPQLFDMALSDFPRLDRELNGLLGAMKFFNMTESTIVTFSNEDILKKDGFTVKVIPAHKYLTGEDII